MLTFLPMQSLKSFLSEHGAIAKLAREIDVTPSAVSQWLASRVPAERVMAVERATGIPRAVLRPDLYSEPSPTQSEAA